MEATETPISSKTDSVEKLKSHPTIREATSDDIRELAQLQWQVRRDAVKKGALPLSHLGIKDISDLDELTDQHERDFVSAGVENLTSAIQKRDECRVFVAEKDGKIIGRAQVNFDLEHQQASLVNVEIDPQHQGASIATQFVIRAWKTTKQMYPKINALEVSRYVSSEDNRRGQPIPNDQEYGRRKGTFFDRIGKILETIGIEPTITDLGNGQQVKHYVVPEKILMQLFQNRGYDQNQVFN